MSPETLVATPDPPDKDTVSIDLGVEGVLEFPHEFEAIASVTPVEIIDCWLDISRYRSTFDSDTVQNMLLDIRNSLNQGTV